MRTSKKLVVLLFMSMAFHLKLCVSLEKKIAVEIANQTTAFTYIRYRNGYFRDMFTSEPFEDYDLGTFTITNGKLDGKISISFVSSHLFTISVTDNRIKAWYAAYPLTFSADGSTFSAEPIETPDILQDDSKKLIIVITPHKKLQFLEGK